MRTIERTNQFKRDYKRESKGQHRATLDGDLVEVVKLLANDLPLAERYHDPQGKDSTNNTRERFTKTAFR